MAEASQPAPDEDSATPPLRSEDWLAVALGGALLLVTALSALWFSAAGETLVSPLKSWIVKPQSWSASPLSAFTRGEGGTILPALLATFGLLAAVFAAGVAAMRHSAARFLPGFAGVFALAVLAYFMAAQELVKYYNLEYALWALVVGLIISNTVGTPAALRPAVRTEFYIKTGLVLLGAEVLFHRLLALGVPGIFIAWIVTPVVLISTYLFGQKVLKIESRSLNMVISADMSVCGVSAAIAAAAACKAKKEELSLAIGMSLSFTVLMMVILPAIIKAVGMGEVVGGAWLGGTIDSTGAVAAAGGMLGDTALQVATTIKMIQNILIGVVAFGIAVYWVTRVERDPNAPRPSLWEIWHRFPKFVLGFVAASLIFSWIAVSGSQGDALATATTGVTKQLRGWCFCLAFVSIGLETNFSRLAHFMKGGKPLVLYACGQLLNLVLTLLMAWLMFTQVFPDAAAGLLNS